MAKKINDDAIATTEPVEVSKIINRLPVKGGDFNLSSNDVVKLTSSLVSILDEKELLRSEFKKISALEITNEVIPQLKELRIKIRDNRTKGIEIWHKTNKEFFLTGGRFVDAIKNKECEDNQWMEQKLLDGENYFINIEKARIAKLVEDRTKETAIYEADLSGINLGALDEVSYRIFLEGAKGIYLKKKEADKIAAAYRERCHKLTGVVGVHLTPDEDMFTINCLKDDDESYSITAEYIKTCSEEEFIEVIEDIMDVSKMNEDFVLTQRAALATKEAEESKKKAAEAAGAKAKVEYWISEFSVPKETPKLEGQAADVVKLITEKHAAFLTWAKSLASKIQ